MKDFSSNINSSGWNFDWMAFTSAARRIRELQEEQKKEESPQHYVETDLGTDDCKITA